MLHVWKKVQAAAHSIRCVTHFFARRMKRKGCGALEPVHLEWTTGRHRFVTGPVGLSSSFNLLLLFLLISVSKVTNVTV